ncbi:ABC transporter permease [Luteimicrobium subarcticum]|uniref:ABC-type nitrate/sulfonate/bicarbonate transport system permease component n=1 Tax=Luteimicrobium subarcticum TaxID=620910 RepID=A0A2M8W1D6_9MICO|nr:ABC transporter permease subunit [Luteimicrobium subarcticum]PJI84720.1 ABC-type nitrate/sulfonate/bicarbonate transport system permease component [Luteimicrobium subarcticum]
MSAAAEPGPVRPAAGTPGPRERRHLPPWAVGLLGAVALVAVWWIGALTVFADVGPGHAQAIPTPWQVVQQWADDGWEFYRRNFQVTLAEAGLGFLWGNGAALVLSALVLVVPRLEGAVTQIAIITYCVPIVAIGILVSIIIPAPEVGHPAGTAVFLAALSCFFTTVVGTLLGLKAADRSSLDVVAVLGGGRLRQLVKVRLVAALPSVLTALQIAVPAAFLGAILGEYLGGVDVGIGPAMTNAQNTLNAARVWGLALASGAVAMIGYLLLGLVARFVTPWTRGRTA